MWTHDHSAREGKRIGLLIVCAVVAMLIPGRLVLPQQTKKPRSDDVKGSPITIGAARGVKPGHKTTSDGKIGLSVSGASAQFIEVATRKPIGQSIRHPDHPRGDQTREGQKMRITTWAFSPDGKMVATGSRYETNSVGEDQPEGDVRVWEVPTGKLLASTEGGHGYVKGLAFSDDGRTVQYSYEPLSGR